MKTVLSLLLVTFIFTSCDLPQRQRQIASTDIEDTSTQNSNGNTGNDGNSGNGGNGGSNDPGFETCSNQTPNNGNQIGFFGLCKSSNDERQFKVKFAQGSTTGTCFVPSHKYSNGSSFKLGIAECVHNQANQSYYMTLNKEMMPPNFTSPRTEPINAVMVLTADAVNAYMSCMNAKESYMLASRVVPGNYSTPPCCLNAVNYNGKLYCLQTNSQCEAAANNYANSVCSSFTQNYSGKYKLVDTPYAGDNL